MTNVNDEQDVSQNMFDTSFQDIFEIVFPTIKYEEDKFRFRNISKVLQDEYEKKLQLMKEIEQCEARETGNPTRKCVDCPLIKLKNPTFITQSGGGVELTDNEINMCILLYNVYQILTSQNVDHGMSIAQALGINETNIDNLLKLPTEYLEALVQISQIGGYKRDEGIHKERLMNAIRVLMCHAQELYEQMPFCINIVKKWLFYRKIDLC